MNKHWLEALIIAIGLGVLGLFVMQGYGLVQQGMTTFAAKDRVVTVKGLSEREVDANKVTWPLKYKEGGNDLKELNDRMNHNNEILKTFLTKKGIPETDISINPPEIDDNQVDRCGNSTPPPFRYTITAGLTVTTDKVELVRSIINDQGQLLEQGIAVSAGSYENRVVYEFTRLNDIKPEMIEDATKNARLAADKFAQDSGSRLGKIMHASQGQFSVEDRDDNTPYVKKVRVVSTIQYALED